MFMNFREMMPHNVSRQVSKTVSTLEIPRDVILTPFDFFIFLSNPVRYPEKK